MKIDYNWVLALIFVVTLTMTALLISRSSILRKEIILLLIYIAGLAGIVTYNPRFILHANLSFYIIELILYSGLVALILIKKTKTKYIISVLFSVYCLVSFLIWNLEIVNLIKISSGQIHIEIFDYLTGLIRLVATIAFVFLVRSQLKIEGMFITCHSCGLKNEPDSRFCTQCGVSLTPVE